MKNNLFKVKLMIANLLTNDNHPRETLFRFFSMVVLSALIMHVLFISQAYAGFQPYISGHKINFGTGNKYEQVTDISLSGPGAPLTFSRTYNSQSTQNTILGYGWTGSFGEYLELDIANNRITLIQSSGRHIDFINDGNGNYINQTGKQRTIVAIADDYQLSEPDGDTATFDLQGLLIQKNTKNNLITSYTYTDNLLTSVSNDFGKSLTFTYQNNKLYQVAAPNGSYTYSYDVNENLISVEKPDTTTIQYIYDDPNDLHNLTGIIDENNTRITTITYDTSDRVTSSEKANGNEKYTINYLEDLQRTIVDNDNNTTTYQLEVNNGIVRVTSFIGPGCSSCGDDSGSSYVYNDRLQVVQKTDARGTVTAYEYDSQGNRTKLTEALGVSEQQRVTSYTYTVDNRVDTITRNSDRPIYQISTSHSYDANGNLLSKTESGDFTSRTTTYTYDTYGRITSIDGPRTDVSDITTFSYYPNDAAQGLNRGNLQSVTNALGHSTSYSNYTAFGKAQTITDPLGTTSSTYDTLGRLLSRSRNGIVTSYVYDFTGKLATINLPDSRTISYSYTADGKISSLEDSLGNKISYFYDARGQKNREEIHDSQSVLQHFVDYAYHPSGKLSTTTYADGSSEQLDYDEVGNLVSKVNALNNTTSYAYDALNRLATITEPGSIVTAYTYHFIGFLDYPTITDAEGHTTSISHDDLGRKDGRTSPDTGLTSYTYDEADNLLSSTDAAGITTSYEYDALNRWLAVHYPDSSQDVVYTYDQNGHTGLLTTMQDSTGTTSYDYDTLGRLSQESRTQNGLVFTTGYGYNNNSELINITYPGGRVITYNRDTTGNVVSVTTTIDDVTTTIVDSIAYLPFGPTAGMTLGNGINVSNSYDQLYRLTNSTAGTVYNRNYNYFATGNVDSITDNLDPTASQNFTYDDLGRLTTALGKYGSLSWSYDNVGNRLSQVMDAETISYGYTPDTNQLILTDAKKDIAYAYDAVGNTTSANDTVYNWNQNNRLTSVDIKSKTVGTYGYDGSGRRTVRTADGNTIHSLYDASGNVLMESDEAGNILNEYVYLNGTRLALFSQTGTTHYYISDHLSTAQLLVDDQGAVVWQGNYSPFGAVDVVVDTVESNFRFPGQYFDGETGLHYNWNRFYDPGTGRYISADPIGLAGGMNLYAYVGGNPVNFTDPMGLDNPGCDKFPNSLESPCVLECCASHDECYDRNQCSADSWCFGSDECAECNNDVSSCIILCIGSGKDDPSKPNYYCPRQHRYVRIPGDFPDMASARRACSTDAPPAPTPPFDLPLSP